MEMVGGRLSERDTIGRGFVLDGCPRTTLQAEMLEKIVEPARRRPGDRPAGPDRSGHEAPRLAPRLRGLRRQLLDRRPAAGATGRATSAAARWSSARTTPRRRSSAGSNLYEEETAPAARLVQGARAPVEVNGTGSPDAVHPARRRGDRHRAPRKDEAEMNPVRRNDDELAKMRRAGKVVAEMHEATRAAARPGVTHRSSSTQVAREVLERRGATSNFLGYHGFPAVICTSPNSMIVHGIPGDYVLEEGDILSIDCGAIIEGYHGDAAFTMGIGEISKEAQKLLEVTERSLWAGIEQMTKGNPLNEIGPGGPGRRRGGGLSRSCASTSATPSGRRCTSSPRCPTTGRAARDPTLKTGNVFAVEPMVNVGSRRDGDPRRRLERGHRRRQALGPLRAHHRHHRGRAAGLHDALTPPGGGAAVLEGGDVPGAAPAPVQGSSAPKGNRLRGDRPPEQAPGEGRSGTMLTSGFNHVVVLTADTGRFVDFYREVFGAEELGFQDMGGHGRLTFVRIGEEAEFQRVRGGGQHGGGAPDPDARARPPRPPRPPGRLARLLRGDPPPPRRPWGQRRVRDRLRPGPVDVLPGPRRAASARCAWPTPTPYPAWPTPRAPPPPATPRADTGRHRREPAPADV